MVFPSELASSLTSLAPFFRLLQVYFKPIFYDFSVVAKWCLSSWPRNKPLLILVDAGSVVVCPNSWRDMWRDAKGKRKTILGRDESCEGIALAGTFCSVILRLLLSLKLVAWQQNLIAALFKMRSWHQIPTSEFFRAFRASSASVKCLQDRHLLQL